ncbi:MAG: transglycosylase domain-containing protein [Butyrivibrio sp.]
MDFSSTGIRKKQRELSSPKRKVTSKIFIYIFKGIMTLFVFAGVTGVCLGVGALRGIIDTAPEISINDVTPSQYKTTIYDCKGVATETLVASGANRIYVTIDEIPEHLQNAFIALEDERFYQHNGIDARGIIRSAYIGIKNNFQFTQGGSTITQQLIKNSVFSVENEHSLGDRLKRKIQEQYLALQLEKETGDKKKILENYLNTINLGNNNLGVQAAAHNYFNKDVSELTISESAVIAATTQNPYANNPIRFPERNAKRRQVALDNMLKLDMITKEEYDEAVNDDVYSRIQNLHSSSTGSKAYSYYTDALIETIMDDLMTQKGYTYTQAYNLLYRGGLSIYSCEDHELQTYAEDVINNPDSWNGMTDVSLSYRIQVRDSNDKLLTYSDSDLLKYIKNNIDSSRTTLIFSSSEEAQPYIDSFKEYILAESGGKIIDGTESATYTLQPQTSFVLIENGTGETRVIVGGRGDKTQSLVLNRATSSQRQPGSTIKPLLVYGPAIDTGGYSLASVCDDVPFYYSNGKEVNNDNNQYYGYTTIRDAIAQSRNIPAVKTLDSIGIDTGISYLKNMGITTLTDNDYYLPVALGTCGVTNFELTAAYTTIPNGGQYVKPKLYTKILDHDGNVILDNTETQSTQVMKESTAWLLSSAMRSVVTNGSLQYLYDSNVYLYGKSGTSQNYADRWHVGVMGNYTAGIWMGYDSNISKDLGTPYGYVWRNILNKANENVDCSHGPEQPASVVSMQVCKDSGLLAVNGLCDCDPRGSRVVTEYFDVANIPTTYCNVHMKVNICEESGKIASDNCPANKTKNAIRIYKNVSREVLEDNNVSDAPYAITDSDLDDVCTVHKASGSTTKPAKPSQTAPNDEKTTTSGNERETTGSSP